MNENTRIWHVVEYHRHRLHCKIIATCKTKQEAIDFCNSLQAQYKPSNLYYAKVVTSIPR